VVTLEVVDTGVGLRADIGSGTSLGTSLEPELGQSGGFGLAQVRERLTTVYGKHDATLTISHYATGTLARVTFYSKDA
jgi:sensor histidine kinase YesM